MMINILGTYYTIVIKDATEDKEFENCNGYCSSLLKEIVICNLRSRDTWKDEPDSAVNEAYKRIVRHEIVHAFFDESGLEQNANQFEGAWSKNEEMIDFFAIQGLKIYNAWKEAKVI